MKTAFFLFLLATVWALLPAFTDLKLGFPRSWITVGLAALGFVLTLFAWIDTFDVDFSVWALLGMVDGDGDPGVRRPRAAPRAAQQARRCRAGWPTRPSGPTSRHRTSVSRSRVQPGHRRSGPYGQPSQPYGQPPPPYGRRRRGPAAAAAATARRPAAARRPSAPSGPPPAPGGPPARGARPSGGSTASGEGAPDRPLGG